MTRSLDPIDERLQALRAATETLEPSSSFEDRLAVAVAQESFPIDLWRTGRFAVAAFTVAAAVSLFMAAQSRSSLDSTVLANVDPIELDVE